MSQSPKRKRPARKRAAASDGPIESKSLAVPDSPANSMMNFIAQALTNKDIDEHKLEVLLRLQRDVRADEAKERFFQAMFRVQAKLKPLVREGSVDLTKRGETPGSGGGYKFLRREDLDKVLRPLMEEEGFSISYTQRRTEQGLVITGELFHVSGHSRTSEITLPPDTGAGRNPLQAIGSSISYAERYLAEMLFNIVRKGDDDDGVKSDMKVITAEQVQELQDLCVAVGRDEVTILGRLFGDSVHSFAELDPARGFIATKNMLLGIRQMQQQRGGGAE